MVLSRESRDQFAQEKSHGDGGQGAKRTVLDEIRAMID